MSFEASNNRIFITNNDSKVIFDTNKPMPHIVQTITGTVTVEFPAIPCTYWEQSLNIGSGTGECGHQEYKCHTELQYVFETVQVCEWVTDASGFIQYVCHPEMQGVWKNVEVCGFETVYDPAYDISQGFDYAALSWSNVSTLGNITRGIEADFLLVNAVATRTKQGSLADMGSLPCGLPLGNTFVANNSSIIECMSDVRDGSPWMTRIMSVFVEDGKVKVEFKHSNRSFRAVSSWWGRYCTWPSSSGPWVPGIPHTPPQGDSSFSFLLTVRVGKFTI